MSQAFRKKLKIRKWNNPYQEPGTVSIMGGQNPRFLKTNE
jgi:hypothetical protein